MQMSKKQMIVISGILTMFFGLKVVSAAASNSTAVIVVAITNIPDGKVIEQKDVTEAYVKKGRPPGEAVNTLTNAVGRVSLGILKGELVIHKKGKAGLNGHTLRGVEIDIIKSR
jgi:flagella basal body P-ring formation protein FlgA